MIALIFILCATLGLNFSMATKSSTTFSTQEFDDCVEANYAWRQCKKKLAKNCGTSPLCANIFPTGALMIPANLSLTDQALWESSHHQ